MSRSVGQWLSYAAISASSCKSSLKFPNLIEVGIDVRERVQDWQLETRQTVGIGRQPDGVYTLVFGPTTLLLRPDAADDFIGYPYDSV